MSMMGLLASLFVAAVAAATHYETLGVRKSASQAAIKKQYRALAKRYHPDKSSEPGAEAKFRAVAEAYEVLGDEKKRRDYDAELARPPMPDPRSARRGFGGGGGVKRYARVVRNGRVYMVELEDDPWEEPLHRWRRQFEEQQRRRREQQEAEETKALLQLVAAIIVCLIGVLIFLARMDPLEGAGDPDDDRPPRPRSRFRDPPQPSDSEEEEEEEDRKPPQPPPLITPETSIRELKEEARRRGLSIEGCAEKTDLLELLGVFPRR